MKFKIIGKCDCCGKVTYVTRECEECYFQGFDIDKQIKKLKEMKKIMSKTTDKTDCANL
jgi:hypothetical protein